MIFYIEWLFLPRQSYHNLDNADRKPAESQNLALVFLSNAKFSSQLFSSVTSSLVAATKYKSDSSIKHISISIITAGKVIQVFNKQVNESHSLVLSDNKNTFLPDCISSLRTAAIKMQFQTSIKYHIFH